MKNQKYIFRGDRSGVFFGTLLERQIVYLEIRTNLEGLI